MKIGKVILTIIFSLSLGLTVMAQDSLQKQTKQPKADECTRYKAIAGYAYKAREYKKVTRAYNHALEECETLEMNFYVPFLYAIKQSRNNSTDKTTKKAYLDTLVHVYELAQKQHGLQKKWQTKLGYYYLIQGKPGSMKRADSSFKIGIHFDGKEVNKGYLEQYYVNLYNLWVQAQDPKAKSNYKKRLIKEYFQLSKYVNQGDMGVEVIEFLSKYFNNAVTDCQSILPDISQFINNLPQDTVSKIATVKNFMSLLEEKGCTDSKEYIQLIDTIIAIDPSIDAIIAKGKLLAGQGKTSAAIKTFKDAISHAESAEKKSDIQYRIATAYYNSGRYRSAYNAGLSTSGKNNSKGYEIAAKSVHSMMNDCGVSTFQRKANNYYALDLAKKSGDASLISYMKSQCPDGNDIFNAGKSVGEQVTLSCWNKTYTIKKY